MDSSTFCTCEGHLAMTQMPKQDWCEPYHWIDALAEGTIFPVLNLPFYKAPTHKCQCKSYCEQASAKQQNREEMMSNLSAISFALNDLTLYLDTHPDCPKGTALFYELLEKRLELLSEFAGKFYPLTQTSMITGNFDKSRYGWSEGPMPWEGACI